MNKFQATETEIGSDFLSPGESRWLSLLTCFANQIQFQSTETESGSHFLSPGENRWLSLLTCFGHLILRLGRNHKRLHMNRKPPYLTTRFYCLKLLKESFIESWEPYYLTFVDDASVEDITNQLIRSKNRQSSSSFVLVLWVLSFRSDVWRIWT